MNDRAPWHDYKTDKLIDSRELGSIIMRLIKLPCWNVGHYLGSMLYFDFDDRVGVNLRDGQQRDVGSHVISVRDVFWVFRSGGRSVIDSDRVAADSFELIRHSVIGNKVTGVHVSDLKNELTISFSEELSLSIDISNKYNSESNIFELSENQLCIIAIDCKGKIHQYTY